MPVLLPLARGINRRSRLAQAAPTRLTFAFARLQAVHFADMRRELVFDHEFAADLAGLVFVNRVGVAVLVEQVFFDIDPLNRGFAKGAFKVGQRGLCHGGLSKSEIEPKQLNRFRSRKGA